MAKYGFGFTVDAIGAERILPLNRGWFGFQKQDEPFTEAEQVRLALEELGPTFVKLGQVLSTRADLIPPEYQLELAKLQDNVPPAPYADIKAEIEVELGAPPEEIFETFDTQPLAAASIGQVYAATLADGSDVVVKVQRPSARATVEEDLDILQRLATQARKHWDKENQYNIEELAREFSDTLRGELDYRREAHNADRFAANFAGFEGVIIPTIYWDYSTSRIVTMSRVRGIKISELAQLDAAGIDRPALAKRSASILLKMIFDEGFFHADPHPGNFFVEADGTIALIDFGMVGTVDAQAQSLLSNLLIGFIREDIDLLTETFIGLAGPDQLVNRFALNQDLARLVTSTRGDETSELNITAVLEETTGIVREYRLRMPSNIANLLRTITIADGLGTMLDPDFNYVEQVTPYAQRMLLEQYSPQRMVKEFLQSSKAAAELVVELPNQLRRVMSDLERGNLQVGISPGSFERPLQQLSTLVNRLVVGMLTASFIVSLAVLLSTNRLAGWTGFMGVLFGLGFFISAIFGIYLAWKIFRSGM